MLSREEMVISLIVPCKIEGGASLAAIRNVYIRLGELIDRVELDC